MEVFASAHLEDEDVGERVVMLCLSEDIVGCDVAPVGEFAAVSAAVAAAVEDGVRPSTQVGGCGWVLCSCVGLCGAMACEVRSDERDTWV